MRKFYLIALLAVIYALMLVSYLLTKGSSLLTDISYVLPSLVCSISGFYLLKFYGIGKINSLSVLLIVTGFVFWLVAEILWILLGYLDLSPSLSIADFFYLIAYPFMAAGFWLEIKKGKINWTAKKIAAVFPFLLVLFYFTVYYGIVGSYDPELPLLENVVAMSYGVGDTVLSVMIMLILMVIREYRGGKIFFPWFHTLIGMVLFVAADILYAVYYTAYMEGLWPYRAFDFLWGLAYLFFAYGFFSLGFIIKDVQDKLVLSPVKKEV